MRSRIDAVTALISWNSIARTSLFLVLMSYAFALCGCRDEFRNVVWLPTPLAPSTQDMQPGRPGSQTSHISLSQIVHPSPQFAFNATPDQNGFSPTRDLLSVDKIPVQFEAAPEIHTPAPQIDTAGALLLLGVDLGYGKKKTSEDAQAESKDSIEVTFSEVQEQRLDERAVSRLLSSGKIHLTSDHKAQVPGKGVPFILSDPRASSYLMAGLQLASRASVLLPMNTSLDLIKQIRQDPVYGSRIEVAMRDGRWELSSRLSPPRPVAAGILPLREHHSKREHVVSAPQSPARVAVNLNWIESLPHPTTRWKSAGDRSFADLSNARSFLDSVLTGAGSSQGTPFEMPTDVGVLTDTELLKSEDSPDAQPDVKVNSYPWSRIWCAPFDCVIGTTREYVLVVGGEPKVAISIDPNNTQSINEQLKYLLKQKPYDPKISDSACYSLVYIYGHHWSGRFEPYDFDNSGILAQNHLAASKLVRMVSCK